MGVVGAAQASVALVIERAVLDAEVTDKGPDLGIAPIDDRMDADKVGPAMIGAVEMRQLCAMGVCPPGAHEDGSDGRVQRQVGGERRPQRRARRLRRIPCQLEMVLP